MPKGKGAKGKGGGKAGGGGAGGATANMFSHDRPPMTPADLQKISDRWVTVELKLVTWTYLNFSIKVPSSTNLYIVEQRIKERHCGSITRLQLWKQQVHPKNVMKDFSRTLAQEFRLDDTLTAEDEAHNDTDPDCVIFYDFHPHESECPLLLRSPRDREDNYSANATKQGR
eukprot:TRINITY_DN23442_c0_g1_i1.p1 TRINITY_DN23442_c0_g1~~TRINITY_DN23442_c0_g1_i1.p1  ORF type:complete len:171 (+),score=59.59 TRINITY_DN23442_c0_g1_i1:78-590(+)